MLKEIGVFNAPPVYVLGLKSLPNQSGYAFEPVVDLLEWVTRHRPPTLLVGVRTESDLEVIVELRDQEPDSVVVTVIDDYSIDSFRESLAAGAAGAVSRDSGAAELVFALNAAVTHSTVMPTSLARTLAANGNEEEPPCIEDFKLGWLQSMARGTTVAGLGQSAGYSEREMYRRLRAIYHDMGVCNRTEALLKASRLGWIS